MLTVEDGRMVNGSFDRLEQLAKTGVRAIALTWNFENCFGAPNSRDPKIMSKGLSAFGKEAIEAMNELGILVDVSHLSDGGFYDVAKISKKPFVATHSDCRALAAHPRNLTDDMIRLLAQKGGVSGINFAPAFLDDTQGKQYKPHKRYGASCKTLYRNWRRGLRWHWHRFRWYRGKSRGRRARTACTFI